MERFQGHINPCFLDRKADMRSVEVKGFTEEGEESLQESMPFLQMLQTEEDFSPFLSIKDPNFLALMSLQKLKEPCELETYLHSLVQSETNRFNQNPISASSMEVTNQEPLSSQANMMLLPPSSSSSANPRRKRKISELMPQETTREKRKRRKTKPSKNIEEIENQRINHIAVERNRRRQMNEHLNSLRSLLPPSYIQRGDQASIVGGAINYVKVLEQIIQSLELQKRNGDSNNLLRGISSNNLWTIQTIQEDQTYCIPKIEAIVSQNHVNLKVQCPKKQGQLLKGIITLEKLKLTVLHLNIVSSSHSSVTYSFNLKMEDDCDLESADEITTVARQIFDVR